MNSIDLLSLDGHEVIKQASTYYNSMLVGNFLFSLFAVIALRFFITVPYGKFLEGNALSVFHIPAWFGWGWMESPALFVGPMIYCFGNKELTNSPYVMLVSGLFMLHYINRSIIYPLSLPPTSQATMSMITASTAFIFQLANCYLLFMHLFYLANPHDYTTERFWDVRFLIGMCLFLFGAYTNIRSDAILRSLKGKKIASSNKDFDPLKVEPSKRYSIPKGGMFEYVSCANYFGEIIEWTGFAVLCWSASAALFAWWTCANLVPRAIRAHDFYKKTFGRDYPADRAAVIPFLI